MNSSESALSILFVLSGREGVRQLGEAAVSMAGPFPSSVGFFSLCPLLESGPEGKTESLRAKAASEWQTRSRSCRWGRLACGLPVWVNSDSGGWRVGDCGLSLPGTATAAPRHTITGYGHRAHTNDARFILSFLSGFCVWPHTCTSEPCEGPERLLNTSMRRFDWHYFSFPSLII